MQRCLEPEWLDALAADDPRAVGSRRDLRRINGLMGNAAILAGAVARHADRPPRAVVDLGAGDGALALQLARRLAPRWPGVRLVLVDRTPAVADATLAAIGAAGWRAETAAADVFDWCDRAKAEPADMVVANLFLHHFAYAALSRLFALLATRGAVVAACEPRRAAIALAGSRLVGLIGGNRVTRHDAVVSVRAGFTGRELSALWPQAPGWTLEERAAGWSSHLFVARPERRGRR